MTAEGNRNHEPEEPNMRRKRRRPVYYSASSMNDGTVLAAHPIRKPADRIMKRDGDRLDADGVCQEFVGSRTNSFRFDDPGRFRFFDLMANRLNTRRAIRELVQPQLESLHAEVADLKAQVQELVTLLSSQQDQ
jgi:hypothetical protein